MSGDRFTEISSESWFGRLGNAIKGVLIGAVLVVIGVVVLFWNEGRAVKTAKGLAEGAKVVVSVKSDAIDLANDGKLIHFTAQAITSQRLDDGVFGVAPSEMVLKLRREVQMYQWKETTSSKETKKLGGGTTTETTYDYTRTWEPKPVSSQNFKHPEGHQNAAAMAYSAQTFVASPIKAGAFTLSSALADHLTNFEKYPVAAPSAAPVGPEAAPVEAPVTPSPRPVAMPTGIKGFDGGYYKGADPASPQIGDLKVTFSVVKAGPVSVIAKQMSGQLEGYLTQTGTTVLDLRNGTLSAADMFTMAQAENAQLTWILRGAGFLAIWIGFALMLSPLTVVADVIPLLGDLLGVGVAVCSGLVGACLSLVTIGMAWLYYRPVLGIALFVVAGGALVATKMMGRSKNTAARAAAAAG
ncbi:MAG: TMEM43 family protein [Tepidisphaerales bacterium]